MHKHSNKNNKIAIIIGAGPAGLTAAYELLKKSNITPIILESTNAVGGISQTINYKGNKIDIGPHRFFSKSNRILEWWFSLFPPEFKDGMESQITSNLANKFSSINSTHKEKEEDTGLNSDKIMLIKKRLTRILFQKQFFDYPLTLSGTTLRKLGFISIMQIGFSYLYARLFPIKNETSLEDFFINRFGHKLYLTFFKHYTEKVWGVPCTMIKPDWGAQRIKGLSIAKVITHAIGQLFKKNKSLEQKNSETSLIEYFFYPPNGAGQLWQEVADKVVSMGGKILLNQKVTGFELNEKQISKVEVKDETTGVLRSLTAEYFISSMPVRDLVQGLKSNIPQDVRTVSDQLCYRDLIVVGLLFSKLTTSDGKLPDNWIYVQEPYVKLGRLQIFNNWSPNLIKDPDTVWLGLEYFCNKGDELWVMNEKELISFGKNELNSLGLVETNDFIDGMVIRMPKAYPAYFGGYEKFHVIRNYLDQFENLFLIGRNGMHKYNNQDHSMLAAMTAVDNIINGITTKDNLWEVNTEEEYHEEKKHE
jgi:protoporphyrinogen oxidase